MSRRGLAQVRFHKGACSPKFNGGACRNPGAAVTCILVAAFSLLGSGLSLARPREKHASPYRDWLERDVAYIITKEEKQAFLKLTRDQDRDRFIERFWEVRNSTPGAPTNPYKEEHYRRLQYANQHFGHESGTQGWRTDQGRVYIALGPPQQKAFYTNYRNLRPMEIWFYSSSQPALPPFFYVVFYQRETAGDFRLYSPYLDGPERLVTTMRAVNDRVRSLKVIEESAGREVARIALSLLPDEPVDLNAATASLQSDVLLSHIRNLANDPLTKANIDRQRQILESVTSRLILGGEFVDVLAVALRDSDGNTNLHYVLRLKKPEDFSFGRATDGRYYYSISVTARVFGGENNQIFTQEKKLSSYFDQNQLIQLQNKVFGYEGRLPLPPGKYKIEFVLSNLLKQTAFRAEKEVVIPEVPPNGMRITPLVPFSSMEAVDPAGPSLIPFSAAGVKFDPLIGQELNLAPGQDLKIFYQIWAPANDPGTYQGKKLVLDYVYGRLGVRGDSKVLREDVQKQQFDRSGSLVNGKKIPLADLPDGNYLLTVNLSDPQTQQKANATLGFRVSATSNSTPAWDIYDEEAGEDPRKGLADYQRGLCYLAFGEKERAVEWFQKALQKNPTDEQARAKLVDLFFARQAFAEVANLYARVGINAQTEEQTILRVADSFDRLGNTKKAISLLESALNVKTGSGPLYLALASYYQRSGDLQKAAELERKGKSLMAQTSPTS